MENNLNEIWKGIEGYEGLYFISNHGRVKSLCSGKEKIRLLHKRGDYLAVTLKVRGVSKNYRVHNLVGNAFIFKPDNAECLNHINGIKEDNRAVNLEWCTYSFNNIHALDTGLRKSIPKGRVYDKAYQAREIIQYSESNLFIKKWSCARKVQDELNIKESNINKCLHGKRRTAGGYKWAYAS